MGIYMGIFLCRPHIFLYLCKQRMNKKYCVYGIRNFHIEEDSQHWSL
jgi:hypothetical protein